MKLTLPDGTLYQTVSSAPKLYRVLHDHELPRGAWRVGLPEVFILNSLSTPFGADWQRLSYALNPGMDPKKWRATYAYNRAFNNGCGFNDDSDPRADYVNGLDLSSPLPKWDKTRVCGGALITGYVDGADLVVEIMDGTKSVAEVTDGGGLEWLLARPWLFFKAINAGTLSNFPQNGGRPVLVPLVGSGAARIPLAGLEAI